MEFLTLTLEGCGEAGGGDGGGSGGCGDEGGSGEGGGRGMVETTAKAVVKAVITRMTPEGAAKQDEAANENKTMETPR